MCRYVAFPEQFGEKAIFFPVYGLATSIEN